jgi:hypothetical protein
VGDKKGNFYFNQLEITHKMSYCHTDITYTRKYLRDLPDKRRRDAISQAVANLRDRVIEAANAGKVFHLVNIQQFAIWRNSKPSCYPPPYIPTDEDLVEGFKNTFPDCKVEYTEMWEDIRPGVREQKKGILVDWS